MDLGVEAVGVGEFGDERGELGAFGLVERAEDVGALGFGGPPQCREGATAGVGEVESVMPAVGRVAGARHQPGVFQRVEEHDDSAGGGTQAVGQRPLGQARGSGQDTQKTGAGRSQAQRAHLICKPGRGVTADLGQQERRSGRSAGRAHCSMIAGLTE